MICSRNDSLIIMHSGSSFHLWLILQSLFFSAYVLYNILSLPCFIFLLQLTFCSEIFLDPEVTHVHFIFHSKFCNYFNFYNTLFSVGISNYEIILLASNEGFFSTLFLWWSKEDLHIFPLPVCCNEELSIWQTSKATSYSIAQAAFEHAVPSAGVTSLSQ